jgi:flagellar motor switch protein FliN
MDKDFIDILKKLVEEQGKEVFSDLTRCKNLLHDYTKGEYKKETLLILRAVEAGVPKAIDTSTEIENCKKIQTRKLQEEQMLITELAADVVNVLESVLRQEGNIPSIMDVYMEIDVSIGRTRKLINEILAMGEGTIIELDKLAHEPVDILVNHKLIAKGEVVVIDENFGVRVTEIVSPKERMNDMK